jgi:hypothetical protein
MRLSSRHRNPWHSIVEIGFQEKKLCGLWAHSIENEPFPECMTRGLASNQMAALV